MKDRIYMNDGWYFSPRFEEKMTQPKYSGIMQSRVPGIFKDVDESFCGAFCFVTAKSDSDYVLVFFCKDEVKIMLRICFAESSAYIDKHFDRPVAFRLYFFYRA